ncbi:hypothetical protein GDO78_006937 [Eleutherodactylus coqui]|uniref:Secreted protein n=1 Tax=Eleutherodactylus coqui TaxID=57060 RepID=A0A8J6FEM4_ELECQ|nr:hypothetical protein GDO78_006937 [Eleutherodactylus coqui]
MLCTCFHLLLVLLHVVYDKMLADKQYTTWTMKDVEMLMHITLCSTVYDVLKPNTYREYDNSHAIMSKYGPPSTWTIRKDNCHQDMPYCNYVL